MFKSEYIFDWSSLGKKQYLEDMDSEVSTQVEKVIQEYGTIPLDELFLFRDRGGQRIIEELSLRKKADLESGKYKIRVMIHEDGRTPKAGDEYRWVNGTKATFIDGSGKRRPMNTAEQEKLRKRCRKPGDKNDWRIWRVFTIDKDCCFICGFHDAMAVMTNMSEHSIYPASAARSTGEPIHYWQVEQVPLDYSTPKPKANRQPKKEQKKVEPMTVEE